MKVITDDMYDVGIGKRNYQMLRKLMEKDVEYMLEWMQDKSITCNFKVDFSKYNGEKVRDFIKNSYSAAEQHFAVVNKEDEYLGTISLKKISLKDKNAEYAIVMRKSAQGEGIAERATKELIEYAFNVLGLRKIYLNVLEDNIHAIRFYEKLGFIREGTFVGQYFIGGRYHNLCWYAIYHPDLKMGKETGNYKLLKFQEKGDQRGHLVIIEGGKEIPFAIKRIFYIYGSDARVTRGQHANRETEFVLINIAGSSKVKIYDGKNSEIIKLDKPHMGVYLPRMVWKDMYDFSPDSILLVLASEYYDPKEYIRDLVEYEEEIKKYSE